MTASTGAEKRAAQRSDGLEVGFDDDRAVAGAGLILPATLAQRLGLEGLVDETADLGRRPIAPRDEARSSTPAPTQSAVSSIRPGAGARGVPAH